uniref:Tr-type G domain-containing protein n=1 Tax=Acrobeloides nanus TaxID=290746 RepID=A0A914C408_9BILA
MIILRLILRNFPYKHQFTIRRCLKISKETAPINRIRNIGIIAHIDAGKTTISERLLYLSGVTKTIGDVDSGDTVTDFMELERERGITIQSAAITSFWRNHRINLIDTPGHVDFTVEVERCLRVLDGVVTLLDGSAGVQAQTLTVWRQAKKFEHPAVFFVNKMDKPNSNFDLSINSVEHRLNIPVCAISKPLYKNDKHVLLIDLINRKSLNVLEDNAKWETILHEELYKATENLYSKIADVDESFGELVLNSESYLQISPEEIKRAIRKATLARKLSPIACGSGLRSTASVIPVLDMVVDFLPSPIERNYRLPNAELCALVFKISHDKKKGRLGYIRVYKGVLDKKPLFNVNRQTLEADLKIFTPYSDELASVDSVSTGNIAVVSGLKDTITGDTLINNLTSKGEKFRLKDEEYENYKLEGIETPDPVFFCSVEPPNLASLNRMQKALAELSIEDPSLRIREDNELNQTVIEGMGELHIEIIKERLRREYDLKVFMSPPKVSYKEVLRHIVTQSAEVSDTFGTHNHWCNMSLDLEPSKRPFKMITSNLSENTIRKEWQKAISDGCKNALYNGPVLGFPISNVNVVVKNLNVSGGRVNASLLSACASRCVTEALKKASMSVMEPMMMIEVMVFDDEVEGLIRDVTDILISRRAKISDIDKPEGNYKLTVVKAQIPLAQTTGLANQIRSVTSGMGSFHMEFSGYQEVPEETILQLRGHV